MRRLTLWLCVSVAGGGSITVGRGRHHDAAGTAKNATAASAGGGRAHAPAPPPSSHAAHAAHVAAKAHKAEETAASDCCCTNASEPNPRRPVMLVKQPRTGSSWLATILAGVVDESRGELRTEVSGASGGYAGLLRRGVSFSMEPTYRAARCLDYGALARDSPSRPLVLFLFRCNVVKLAFSHAFSWTFAKHLKACPTARAAPPSKCARNWPYGPDWPRPLNATWLKNQIVCARKRSDFLASVFADATGARAVSYEALQTDEAGVAAALAEAVACGGGDPARSRPRRRLHCGVAVDNGKAVPTHEARDCIKQSGDDLRAFVSNFDEIAAFLGRASPCLRRQLEARDATCAACDDAYWPDAVCDEDAFRHIGRHYGDDSCVRARGRAPRNADWLCPACEAARAPPPPSD